MSEIDKIFHNSYTTLHGVIMTTPPTKRQDTQTLWWLYLNFCVFRAFVVIIHLFVVLCLINLCLLVVVLPRFVVVCVS